MANGYAEDGRDRDPGMEGMSIRANPSMGRIDTGRMTNIAASIDMIDHATERLHSAMERSRELLGPVLHSRPNPSASETEGKRQEDESVSDVQRELRMRAERLERMALQIEDMNAHIDL
jgi:hypothetical protein